jgi:hypothetical protein
MFVKIKTPVTITGLGRIVPGQIVSLTGAEALPLIASGKALPRYGLGATRRQEPDDEKAFQERKERARHAGQNVDWSEQERFKRKPHAGGFFADANGGSWQANESFEAKIVKAFKALAAARPFTRKAHEE